MEFQCVTAGFPTGYGPPDPGNEFAGAAATAPGGNNLIKATNLSDRRYGSLDSRAIAFSAELVRWAKAYAERGIPVFPTTGKKIPLVKWKATGGTTDPTQIETWWKRWHLAMIAMPTGSRSGFIVLDVDVKGAVDGFATMRASGLTVPEDAVEIRTPSGGAHFYFRIEPGQKIRNSAGRIGPGLDIRGEGGMIILPPSRPSLDSLDYHFAEGQEPREMGELV